MKNESEEKAMGAEKLRRFMLDDPQIEALEISHEDHLIKVATIGPIDEDDLKERIGEVLKSVERNFGKLDELSLGSLLSSGSEGGSSVRCVLPGGGTCGE